MTLCLSRSICMCSPPEKFLLPAKPPLTCCSLVNNQLLPEASMRGSSSPEVPPIIVLNMLATFFRNVGDAICSGVRPVFMLRIWLADHDRVSSCRGLFDFPLAVDLKPRGLSTLFLPRGVEVMLLLEDSVPP